MRPTMPVRCVTRLRAVALKEKFPRSAISRMRAFVSAETKRLSLRLRETVEGLTSAILAMSRIVSRLCIRLHHDTVALPPQAVNKESSASEVPRSRSKGR